MTTLAEFRQQYPQYDDMSDGALAMSLYERFYSDMPIYEYVDQLGLSDRLSATSRAAITALQNGSLPAENLQHIAENMNRLVARDLDPDISGDIGNMAEMLARGVIQMPGAAVDLGNLAMTGIGMGVGALGAPETGAAIRNVQSPFGSQWLDQNVNDDIFGPRPEPETGFGSNLLTGAEWGGGAMVPGGIARNALTMGSGAVGGLLADDLGPVAGLLGMIGVGGAANRLTGAGGIARNALREISDEDLANAERLMASSREVDVPLLASEALGSTNMRALADNIAASNGPGGNILDQFLQQRPGQVRTATRGLLDELALPADPRAATQAVADTGVGAIREAQRIRTMNTSHLFDQLHGIDLAPDQSRRIVDTIDGLIERTAENSGRRAMLTRLRNQIEPDSGVETNAGRLWSVYQETRDAIELPEMAEGSQRVHAGILRDVIGSIRSELDTLPEFRTAVSEYEMWSPPVTRMTGSETIPGTVSLLGDATTPRDVARGLLDPEMQRPSGVRTALGDLRTTGAAEANQAVASAVRTHLDNELARATSDLQSGQRLAGGAVLRRNLVGNENQADNLRTLLGELDPEVATGFDRLMEVYERTGRTVNVGSPTAARQVMNERASANAVSGLLDSVNVVQRGGLLGTVSTGFSNIARRRAYEQLANALIDPNGVEILRRLGRVGDFNSLRSHGIALALTAGRELGLDDPEE